MRAGRPIAVVALLLLAAGGAVAADSAAVSAPELPAMAFSIRPQLLGMALNQLALQAHQQIIFRPEWVQDRYSPEISGMLTVDEALARLLQGTGLSAARSSVGVITIVRNEPPATGPVRVDPRQSRVIAANGHEPGAAVVLEEVIVTAARFNQNLQKVSTSVAVVSGHELLQGAATTIAEATRDLSGVQTTAQPGGFSINIRGQGGDLPAGTTQGPVSLQFDGVYNINSQASTVGLFDVDRIEVLAGPQSTRYGPNADGGVVNVVTRDPVPAEYSGYAALNVGDHDRVRSELAVNLPLGDALALRVAAAAIHRGSYFTPAQGNDVGQSIRIKLLYQPAEDFSLKLQYQLDHIGGTGNGSNVLPIYTTRVTPYVGDSINDYSDPWRQGGDHPVNGLGAGQDSASLIQRNLQAHASYLMSHSVALDVVASYQRLGGAEDVCTNFPPSGPGWGPWTTGGMGNCFTIHEFHPFFQYSGEARLHGTPGQPVVWNLGLYHWNYYWASYWPFQAIAGPAGGTSNSTATNAVFGEMTRPLTRRLRWVGGARQSFDLRRQNFGPDGGQPTPTGSLRERHFDYRAGLEFDLAPRSMMYLTASSGYRPGGLNQLLPDGRATTFANEVNDALELGSKNLLLDKRLEINAAAFYYRQRGYQDLDKYFTPANTVVINGQTVVCDATNVGLYSQCQTPTFGLRAHALGLESQLRFRMSERDQLKVSASWLNARFDRHQSGPCAVLGAPTAPGCWDGYNPEGGAQGASVAFFNIAGAVQPHSPKFAGTSAYERMFPLASGARLSLGGDFAYSTGYYVNPVEDAYGWQPAYWLVNLAASFASPTGAWSANAYVHNLADYAVKTSVLPATTIGEPRTYGVVINRKW